MSETQTGQAKMVTPPNKIKQKMGDLANPRDLLKPENVQQAQMKIDAQKDNFIEWARDDVRVLSNTMQEAKEAPLTPAQVETIVEHAEHLRDRGGTFGYDLMSQIAKSLVNYCATIHAPNEKHTIVVREHIEGLTTVLLQKVEGTGGVIGIELMKGLKQLTDKFAN